MKIFQCRSNQDLKTFIWYSTRFIPIIVCGTPILRWKNKKKTLPNTKFLPIFNGRKKKTKTHPNKKFLTIFNGWNNKIFLKFNHDRNINKAIS